MKKRMIDVIKNPYLIFSYYAAKNHFKWMNDKLYLKLMYRAKVNKKLNIRNPETFNEKLQWLKIYDRKDYYINLVDKFEVKKYIEKKIGINYVIPTYGVYDKFDDIKFNNLPNEFVIKCTHDQGSVVVCKNKNKIQKEEIKKFLEKKMKINKYYYGREWPYKNVKPRIMIEKLIKENGNEDLKDYKFFCFNGKVKIFKIDFDRFTNHGANYFDVNGKLLNFGENACPPDYNKKLDIPDKIDLMIKLAEKISKDIPFVRIDFYYTNKKIYFGEITFFPAAGFGTFTDDKWDKKLGNWIKLKK